MIKTTTELTIEYIKEHPTIKSCLKKGLINYSALARLIAKDLKIEKKTSMEAILIAARRFQEKLKGETNQDKKIAKVLTQTEIEIKNKIVVLIFEKKVDFGMLQKVQKKVNEEKGTFHLLEGSDNYTLITQEKYAPLIKWNFIHKQGKLALIKLKSPSEIETTRGVIAYLTTLFAENGVNIPEFFSCWTETIFVIDVKDVNKTMEFLEF